MAINLVKKTGIIGQVKPQIKVLLFDKAFTIVLTKYFYYKSFF